MRRSAQPGPLPRQGRCSDPIKMLLAIDFSKYVSVVQDFTDAVAASQAYERGELLDEPRPKQLDPNKAKLQRARQQLDITTCLIERRLYRAALANGDIVVLQVFFRRATRHGK